MAAGFSAPTMFWAGVWRSGAQDPLLAGDVLDLAFTVDYNQHPDFGRVHLICGLSRE